VLTRFTDAAYSDELNHASLIDGLRLSRVDRVVYPHGSLPPRAMRRVPALIVTESPFGMDGDSMDLAPVLADLNDDDILLVDEAHALRVSGPSAPGLALGIDEPRDLVMGPLRKS